MSTPFAHKKSLGQHFLNSDFIPERLCAAANLVPGEVVVEIGPGTGALTRCLLKHGVVVIAVETDPRAIAVLEETFAEEIMAQKLVISAQDARTLDLTTLGITDHGYKVVANIPYYLSGYLFRSFLESDRQPTDLVFLVQKEVAERITRDPKSSLLSLSVAAFGTPTYICTVKRGHFTPPPQVDSAIIAIHSINRDHFSTFSPQYFFMLLHLGFGQKRKQLLGNLAAHFERPYLEAVFLRLGLALTVRAEDLTLHVWLRLVAELPGEGPPT